MNDEQLDEMERQVHDAIRMHRECYERAMKPLIDQLLRIQSLRPRTMFVSRDQLDRLDPICPHRPGEDCSC
jgi:hypothetical protein